MSDIDISNRLTDEDRAAIQAYNAERDRVLRTLDPMQVKALFLKNQLEAADHGGNVPLPTHDDVYVIMMHQCRLQVRSFTEEEKAVSRRWLQENGHKTDMECGPDGLPVTRVDGK